MEGDMVKGTGLLRKRLLEENWATKFKRPVPYGDNSIFHVWCIVYILILALKNSIKLVHKRQKKAVQNFSNFW